MTTDEMKLDLQATLDEIVKAIADEMAAKGRVASGRTIRETTTDITTIADGLEGRVLVPKWFQYIEAGSAPHPRGTWFYQTIHKWAKTKHIISGDSPEERRISGAIAHKIITEGTKAFRQGGEDVFTSKVDEILDDFTRNVVAGLQKQAERLI